ncbi:MAG TPA: GxxExxY protein [Pirellulales bacterium]|jgi:GxxExxY protein|nr:GxxExxY protein [Pirellulales bacterium]
MDAVERGCAPIDPISEKVIGAAFKVANVLGCGFLEKIYENALAHELRKLGIKVEQQKSIDVYYDGVLVGFYISDLFVEDQLPVELKVAKALDDAHFAQALNFLKSSGFKVGLLINFGKSKIEIKRIVNSY